MIRRLISVLAASMIWVAGATASHADGHDVTVFKDPNCGCCALWVDHMRADGFQVVVRNLEGLDRVKQLADVPGDLHACHTAIVDGYVVEGHVPAASVQRLLAERPEVRGIAVPGMPMGSPGMPGEPADMFDVITFGDAGQSVFETYRGERRQR